MFIRTNANGALLQHEQRMRCKMRHKLHKRFDEEVHRVTVQRHKGDDCHSRQGNKYYRHNYKWQDCNGRSRCNNYDKCKKKRKNRIPSDCGDKVFTPCLMHGPKSKHTSEEYYKNPKNNKRQVQDKNINTRRITTTRAIQVTMMTCALAPIHWSQVRARCQPLARAKKPMR